MTQLLHRFLGVRTIFVPVLFIILGGVAGGFVVATALLVLLLMFSKKNVLEMLLVLNIFTFFLADNFSGPFSFMQTFRFVVLVTTIFYLLKYKLLQNNHANYLLLFTLVAVGITLLFSPVGMLAVLRSLAFWLVALVIFKLVSLFYLKNPKRTAELLVLLFTLYIGVNLLLVVAPFLDVYRFGRFKGLTGNPNGLALIAMFSYAVMHLIKIRQETTFKSNFFLVFKVALFLLIVLTGSRTALFSVIAFELIATLLYKRALLLMSFLLMGLVYVVFNFVSLEELIYNFGFSDYLRVESLSNASGRTDVWPVAWEEIKKSPWFGNGLMYDNYFLEEYVETNIESASSQWGGVWSSYLSLLLDVGIVGVLAYAYFWVKIYKKARYKNVAIAFVVMCLLSGITESWMVASMNAFTPMVFLFWALQTQPISSINRKRSL